MEEAARVLALAFQDDPLFTYVIPDPEERALHQPAHFAALLRFGHLYGKAFATQDVPVGALVCQPPGVTLNPERLTRTGLRQLFIDIGPDALTRLGSVLDFVEHTNRGDVPPEHWYVMVVGVLPARQGQGIGRALLEPVLDHAAGAGLPCYLDTPQPNNVPFYQQLGFDIHAESVEPESGLRFWTFRRDPPA